MEKEIIRIDRIEMEIKNGRIKKIMVKEMEVSEEIGDKEVFKEDDIIRKDKGGKEMRDKKSGEKEDENIKRRMDVMIGRGIEWRGRIVKNKNRRGIEDSEGNRKKMILEEGKIKEEIEKNGFVEIRKMIDEEGNMREIGWFLKIIIDRIGEEIEDIIGDGVVEKESIMRKNEDKIEKDLMGKVEKIMKIDGDRKGMDIVKEEKKKRYGGFKRKRREENRKSI